MQTKIDLFYKPKATNKLNTNKNNTFLYKIIQIHTIKEERTIIYMIL
jgi:hypothetical protein